MRMAGRGAARRPEACSGRRLELVDHLARGVLVLEPQRVDGGVLGRLGGQGVLGEDGVDRALRLTRAAVDALVRVDVQLAVGAAVEVDAVDRADGDARLVQHVDARLGDHVRHELPPLLVAS